MMTINVSSPNAAYVSRKNEYANGNGACACLLGMVACEYPLDTANLLIDTLIASNIPPDWFVAAYYEVNDLGKLVKQVVPDAIKLQ